MKIYILTLLMTFWSHFSRYTCYQDSYFTDRYKNTISNNSPFLNESKGLIFKSNDGGKNWIDIGEGLPADISVSGLQETASSIMIGTNKGIFKSKLQDYKPTWNKEIYIDKAINGFISGKHGTYASIYRHGFLQELAGTGIWAPIYENVGDKYVLTILEYKDKQIFLAGESGIFKSSDNGLSWKRVFKGAMISKILGYDEKIILASGSKGILRSDDDGENWTVVCKANWADLSTTTFTNKIFAHIMEEQNSKERYREKLLYSMDFGKSWKVFKLNINDKKNISPLIINAGQFYISTNSGLYKSMDEGKNWKLILSLSDNNQYRIFVSGNSLYAVKFNGC